MKRLLVVLAVVLVVLGVVDRLAVNVAEGKVADRVMTSQRLSATPQVQIHGIPFLTQAIGGQYDEITVDGRSLIRGRLLASSVQATLRGVRLPLGAAISGKVDEVRADSVKVTARFPWSTLERAADEPVGLSAAARGGVRVVSSVSGKTLAFVADPAVQGGELVLVPREVAGRTIRFSAPGLPFGLSLRAVTVAGDGLAVTAAGENVVIAS